MGNKKYEWEKEVPKKNVSGKRGSWSKLRVATLGKHGARSKLASGRSQGEDCLRANIDRALRSENEGF